MIREDELKMQAAKLRGDVRSIGEVWQKTSQTDTRTKTIAEAWRTIHARYMIGTVHFGLNNPVSVYNDRDEVVWGPGPLWEAEAYVDLCAAQGVLDALARVGLPSTG